jgi:hypothetical protein
MALRLRVRRFFCDNPAVVTDLRRTSTRDVELLVPRHEVAVTGREPHAATTPTSLPKKR